MKKFLSLALALVMALSLFTVASAKEYKDLSDKDEITYSEAVAVLNKLGIIEGYEDGSFKPDTALNRAQAAKIMCGLLLTQATADKLTVSAAPFKDVSADYWAAAYISYCKNAKILDGYSDGTFRPTATLTGYQFCKMLLTALGYKSEKEGFTGSGWTLNVASKINTVGLTKGNVEFGGNSEVTREEACLYALNMLKATEVEYSGLSVDVTTGDSQVSINNNQAEPVKNNGDSDGNIKDDNLMQFAEEHFGALKISNSNDEDDFGRPSNTWSYRNVSFGTFAKQPDFVYTSGVGSYGNNTEAEDAKALGLKGYKFATRNTADEGQPAVYTSAVNAVVNGQEVTQEGGTADKDGFQIKSMKELASLTSNGTVVEVYVDDDTADLITDVVVVKSQLMQINRVSTSAKTVSLKKVESENTNVKSVVAVDEDNDYYAVLSQMKADDYVVITPVRDGNSYKVGAAYKPTTDSGALSKVSMKVENNVKTVNGVTLNGTAYKLSAIRDGFENLDSTSVVNASKDSTLYLDKYGYAMYITDVTSGSDFFIFSSIYNTLVDGKLVYVAQGYDLEGNAVSLNVGTNRKDTDVIPETMTMGTIYAYSTSGSKNNGEYKITPAATTNTEDGRKYVDNTGLTLTQNASATNISGKGYYASGVKFVYLSVNDGEIDKVTVREGVQKVSGLSAKLVFNKDNEITYVIVTGDAEDATGTNVAFVSKKTGETSVGNKAADIYTLYIDGVKTEGVVSKNQGLDGKFVTYSAGDDNVYTLKEYNSSNNTTSVATGLTLNDVADQFVGTRYLVGLVQDAQNQDIDLNVAKAEVIDLTDYNLGSIGEIKDALTSSADPGNDSKLTDVTIAVIYNGNSSSSSYGQVSYLFVTAGTARA
ncbi:S-layer homology domain-containing protein [Oscillibacter hominis]|uniref:S-layer homology domain-containing protein n=1 Tax=Oscillibacter hominis TaxID=2763056 RepID=A0A7G9B463_9FIRM|nr:S-layer homology domain-containing protein [Oscillibacter hominis]QNL44344.1 S-layer homology domain-containing protein [Oscillibacter hominis]